MAEPREEFLEADKEIPGQKFVCLSFISPENVLANKDVAFFTAFVNDFEIQYKIKATEDFLMKEVRRVSDALSKAEDLLEGVRGKLLDISGGAVLVADISGATSDFKAARAALARDAANGLESHVKENMREFKETRIQEEYETFLFKNRKKLEEEFFTKNNFRTTVRGLKIRGCYDTSAEAGLRAKTLQKLDPSFNVYVGQVGFWLPWDPAATEVQSQEYAEDQLNNLMKGYKENESKKDEFFEEQKRERLANARVRTGAAVTVGPKDAPVSVIPESAAPMGIFEDGDLALAKKRQMAAATEAATEAATGNSIQ
jgi:hypothetical protein